MVSEPNKLRGSLSSPPGLALQPLTIILRGNDTSQKTQSLARGRRVRREGRGSVQSARLGTGRGGGGEGGHKVRGRCPAVPATRVRRPVGRPLYVAEQTDDMVVSVCCSAGL